MYPIYRSNRGHRARPLWLGSGARSLALIGSAFTTASSTLAVTRYWRLKSHEKYCGQFLLRRLHFTPQKLSIELDRPRNKLVNVTFAMAAAEFAEASRVVKIISGEIEPL